MKERILYDNCVKVGWKTVKLGDFIDFVGEGTPDKKNPDYWNGDINWASVKDVKNKYLHRTQDKITKLGLENSSSQLAKNGELILVTRISPGKCVIAKDNIAINQDLKIVKLKVDVSTNFVYYFFTAKENELIKRSSGTTVKGIRLEEIRIIEIDLPPLPEQRAIVSKIELLFSELDNGIANLKLAQEQLKVYRQAVLKKAFEGEFTKKWREQRTDLPDAEDLLEQIREEREDATKISGNKLNKIKPLTESELADLSRLPEGWRWAGLGEIIDSIQAGKSIRCDEIPPKLNELGIVKVSSVSWGEFNENESKTCFNEDAFNSDYIIHKNDFLLSRANTIELVGACVIVKSISKRLMLSDKILKIDFSQNHNNFYSLYYLRSVFGRKEIESLATGNQESMRNIGQDRIKQIKIPICSLPEQQAIVQEIETRLSVCDKIEQDIKETLEKAEALRQSILKKAFEGKLLNEKELAEVRGAENWEPAEVLLERIKAEKTGNGKKEKPATEKLKSIVQEDKGIIQQATLQAFEQIDK